MRIAEPSEKRVPSLTRSIRKLWALLNHRERWQVGGLGLLSVLSGTAQVAGIGSVAPLASVLVDPGVVQRDERLLWVYERLGFTDVSTFVLFLVVGVVGALLISNGLAAANHWSMVRFSWNLQYRMGIRLLSAYLEWPYVRFLSRNSSDLEKNVLSEVGFLTNSIVIPCLSLAGGVVGAAFVLGALLWVNPQLTAAVLLVIGGGYAIIYLMVRKALSQAGRGKVVANKGRFHVLSEAFGSIKETKVRGVEAMWVSLFEGPAQGYARSLAMQQIASRIPRYALEVLAVGSVLLTSVAIAGVGGDIDGVAPMIAVYAFAAMRLMPQLQQIYGSVSRLRFNSSVLDVIYDEVTQSAATTSLTPASEGEDERLQLKREIRLEKLSYTYPGASEKSVDGVSLCIPFRSCVGLVGTTGAGKTTVVDLILGLFEPTAGQLLIDGIQLDRRNARAWQRDLGYVPQEIFLRDSTIAENIAFGVPAHEVDRDAVEIAARSANIHDFIVGLEEDYATIVGERGVRLSGGQRQRIGIARALYHDPEVLVLDEATSDLDQATERAVHEAIERASNRRTVILVAHRLSVTRNCDVLFVLDKGRLVAEGRFDELVESSPLFRHMVGSSAP